MSGAELGTPEFAYLLAAVQAQTVVGLEAPDLFPAAADEQDRIYGQGRKDLEANGWLKPAPDRPAEYDLNADLFEIVAMVANPSYVLAAVRLQPDEASGVALYYVTDLGTAELAPLDKDRFQLGIVPDRPALFAKVADILGLKNSQPVVRGSFPQATFKRLATAAGKGQNEKAQALLEQAGETAEKATSLLESAAEGVTGHLVMLPGDGTPDEGRRISVLGQGKAAWIVFRDEDHPDQVVVANGGKKNVMSILAQWMGE